MSNRTRNRLAVSHDELADFCRRHHIEKLSFFGSVLRDDFRPDIDILVVFETGHIPGFIRLAGMEIEFSNILGGRKVDMRTPEDLSPYFRKQVVEQAEVHYAA